MDSLLPERPLTDAEGDGFWRSHFHLKLHLRSFPLFFDMVSEDFRDRRFAVMTLSCLGLFFFYLAVFNKPESHLSCVTRSGDTSTAALVLNIDGVCFKTVYGTLAICGMMGNVKHYPAWTAGGSVLWVAWALLCFTYDLVQCDIRKEVEDTHSMRFVNFSAVLIAHYVLALVGALATVAKPPRVRVSSSNPSDFPTPVRVNISVFLALWITLDLFISVQCTQTLHNVINLFRLVETLNSSHFASGSWEAAGRRLVTPLPYALLTGGLVALATGVVSVWSLHRSYRRVMTHVLRKQGRCKWLRQAWTRGTHNGMFFIGRRYAVQFVANSLYLYILTLYVVTTIAFFLYSQWFYEACWEFLKVRPLWLPLFFVPLLIKWFYIPRIVDKATNRVRSREYFNFWFLLISVFGVLLALSRALMRFFMGVCLLVGFGYRSDQSIFPKGRESLDSLYTAFCGMVIIHCLEAGVTPS